MGPQLLPPGMSLLRSSLPSAGYELPADSIRLLTAAITMMPSMTSAPRRTVGLCPAPWSFAARSALIRRRRRASWRADVINRPRRGTRRRAFAAATAWELQAGTPLPQRRLASRRPQMIETERLVLDLLLDPHIPAGRGRDPKPQGTRGEDPLCEGEGETDCTRHVTRRNTVLWLLVQCQRKPALSKRSPCCSPL